MEAGRMSVARTVGLILLMVVSERCLVVDMYMFRLHPENW